VLAQSAEAVVAPTLAEWTIKPTGRTARQRRRRRKHMAVRVKSLSSRDGTNCPTTDKNVKAFVVANPGRLQKEAVRSSDVSDVPEIMSFNMLNGPG
jgi:hypothetical protein